MSFTPLSYEKQSMSLAWGEASKPAKMTVMRVCLPCSLDKAELAKGVRLVKLGVTCSMLKMDG